jgi:ubiquinone/menaquinone biosynthesis C-methylase UbiE
VQHRPARRASGAGVAVGDEYQLGHEADELERLNVQGRALAAATRTLLEAAGLAAGMRVVDLGSGAGDMSFVVADVVGPGGEVVGIERAPEAVAQATVRARRRGLENVRFALGDIHDALDSGTFDAVVGRLVLMYVPDPSVVLRTHAATVRSGGVVAPIEFDLESARTIPPTPLASRALSWVRAAFERAGIQPALGRRLWQVLDDAGLEPAGMTSIQPHFGPADPDGPALLAGIVQTLLPVIEGTGVARAEEVDVDTLQRRLRDELAAAQAVFAHPALTCAWAVVSHSRGA